MRWGWLVVLAAAYSAVVMAQEPTAKEPLARVKLLAGEWTGRETGAPGRGRGSRVYELIMDGRYFFARNRSVYPPQEKNPEGEVHEDWQFFSYDQASARLVLRQFHIEGFVIHYLLDEEASEDDRLVFVSSDIENFDGRARYTLSFEDVDTFDETFEIAPAGSDFEVLLSNRWTRRRPSNQP